MRTFVIALVFTAAPYTAAISQSVLKEEPRQGGLRYGQVVLVDDGSCPRGKIKQLTGGKGDGPGSVKRIRKCVAK